MEQKTPYLWVVSTSPKVGAELTEKSKNTESWDTKVIRATLVHTPFYSYKATRSQ